MSDEPLDVDTYAIAEELVLDVMGMMNEEYSTAEIKAELMADGLPAELAQQALDVALRLKSRFVRKDGRKLLGHGLKLWGLSVLWGLGGLVAYLIAERLTPNGLPHDLETWQEFVSMGGFAFAAIASLAVPFVAIYGAMQVLRGVWLIATGRWSAGDPPVHGRLRAGRHADHGEPGHGRSVALKRESR